MAISCQAFYNAACRYVGSGTGNERTAADFPLAVNFALDELSLVADLATRLVHITAVDSTVSDMDNEEGWILYAGIVYHMTRFGHVPQDPRKGAALIKDTADRWEHAKSMYMATGVNSTQATETNDVASLGYLGDS